MLQLTLNIKDKTKTTFFLELLKRMEFVEIVKSNETTDFEVDTFLMDIYQEREKSATELAQKLDNLFDNL
ncbi:MAG: hypothetical protein MUE81_21615 [Thermoflexibacter sp.]|jgi:hypothetical protein|nr:hypothetical protein [Thermoflexibacter sp.]